jgi:ornithine cyclodeaminase
LVLHLDDAAVAELLDLASVSSVVAEAFRAWGQGTAATTPRVRAAASGGMASAMAAVVPPFVGGKVYATKDGRFSFVHVLFDMNGRLLCTLDGDVVTRLRTPAASALAIRHLAVEGATVAALVGTGRQAWHHLVMLGEELPKLSTVRITGRDPAAVTAVVGQAAAVGLPAVAAASPSAAVEDAEVIVTVTSATAPLFPSRAVSDRALVCAVGATKPDRCEIGADLIARCVAVVADDVRGSHAECGDLIQAAAQGRFRWEDAVELHAVAAATAVVPRAGHGPVLFETQGVALQDVAAAGLAWQRHRQRAHPTTTEEELP